MTLSDAPAAAALHARGFPPGESWGADAIGLMLGLPGGFGVLRVALRGDDPRRNVPRTATEQGHTVLAEQEAPEGVLLLLIRRKG